MAFTFCRQEKLSDEIRRLAVEQIDRAIAIVKDTKQPANRSIHEARKRSKHLRALLRLLKSCAPEVAREENEHLREMASDLSHLRDSFVMLETFESLFQNEEGTTGRIGCRKIHQVLKTSANLREQKRQFSSKRKPFLQRANDLRERVQGWSIESIDFDCIKDSMKGSYKQGRSGMRSALQERTPEAFHDWRKRVKEFGYHLDLLKDAWPSLLKSFHNQVDKLGELLGQLNDLNVLQAHLTQLSGLPDEELEPVLDQIAGLKARKELDADLLGSRIFAERPKALMRRLSVYWKVWRTCAP